jgi:hypothetical protein
MITPPATGTALPSTANTSRNYGIMVDGANWDVKFLEMELTLDSLQQKRYLNKKGTWAGMPRYLSKIRNSV